MGKQVWKNARLFCGGADLTTRNNKIDVSAEVEEQDSTAFVPEDVNGGQAWKEVLGGIASVKAAASGQWEAGDAGKVDDVSWADLGGSSAWTICPNGSAVGSLAWLGAFVRGQYTLGDQIGNVAPWSASATGTWPLARGQVLHSPGTARTVAGSGTAQLFQAIPAGKNVYASLHVLSVAGTATPTLTVNVQADDAVGFPSPTTVMSFTPAIARGGQVLRTPGPLTDTYYRVNWTVSGTTPSFLFVAAVGYGA